MNFVTVADLIKKLEKMPPKARVAIEDVALGPIASTSSRDVEVKIETARPGEVADKSLYHNCVAIGWKI